MSGLRPLRHVERDPAGVQLDPRATVEDVSKGLLRGGADRFLSVWTKYRSSIADADSVMPQDSNRWIVQC